MARTDIFAFGAILYEMLAGRRAFERPTPSETMAAILNEEPACDLGVCAEYASGSGASGEALPGKGPRAAFSVGVGLGVCAGGVIGFERRAVPVTGMAVPRDGSGYGWLWQPALCLRLLGWALSGGEHRPLFRWWSRSRSSPMMASRSRARARLSRMDHGSISMRVRQGIGR